MTDPEESSAENVDAFFTSYREAKQPGGGETKFKYYLLGGDDGGETLAAVCEDSPGAGGGGGGGGGGGPTYRNAKNFSKNHGTISTTDRRELIAWLDGIVAEGIARASVAGGITPTIVAAGMAANRASDASGAGTSRGGGQLPKFVTHSQEKFVFPDGRRGINFYLVDRASVASLAVTGEERDTRDGHYSYHKVSSFDIGPPLTCGNLVGVHRWLAAMCGGVGAAATAAGAALSFGKHPPKHKPGGSQGGSKFHAQRVARLEAARDVSNALGKRRRAADYFASEHTGDDVDPPTRSTRRGAFHTLVPIRPRRRGERRSLRTFPGVSLRPHLAFNLRPRRLSTLTDPFQLHPDIRSILPDDARGERGAVDARADARARVRAGGHESGRRGRDVADRGGSGRRDRNARGAAEEPSRRVDEQKRKGDGVGDAKRRDDRRRRRAERVTRDARLARGAGRDQRARARDGDARRVRRRR
jgi:hypothetical protein